MEVIKNLNSPEQNEELPDEDDIRKCFMELKDFLKTLNIYN